MENTILTKEELINLLKANLTVDIDINKTHSNIHTIKTTVKFGNEVISETIKKREIGISPTWS